MEMRIRNAKYTSTEDTLILFIVFVCVYGFFLSMFLYPKIRNYHPIHD